MNMDGMTIKDGKEKREKPVIVKNYTDLQRLKLEKLMKNPDKPVLIPEQPKRKGVPTIPDFVRNVMGSSAGAGSGEFHVYRHLRRKEYARQKYMKEKGEKERLDDEYHNKIESNKLIADSKTAKKRQKRLKRNQRKKNNPKKPKIVDDESENESSDESEAEENPCLESKGSSTEEISQTESIDIVDTSEKEELTCMQVEPEVPLGADKNQVQLGNETDKRETNCSQGKLDQSKVLRQEEENSGEIVSN